MPGGIARYDEDWNPRAFGDNITAWGTPVVLVESGGRPPGWSWEGLTRLNFVALLSVVSRLVADDLVDEDPGVYEALERNQGGRFVDVLVSGGQVWQPDAGPPYRADVAFDNLDRDPLSAACVPPDRPGPSRVREVGDGRYLGSARSGRRHRTADRPRLRRLGPGARGAGVARRRRGDARSAVSGWRGCAGTWSPSERAEALAVAAALSGPGRARDRGGGRGRARVPPGDERTPPGPAASSGVDAVLDALTREEWRTRMAGRSLGSALGALTRCPDGPPARPALTPEGPATFLVLRPRGVSLDEAAALSLSAHEEGDGLDLERVFIDGREPARGE